MLDKQVAVRSTSLKFSATVRRMFRSFPRVREATEPDILFSIIVAPPSKNRLAKPFHFIYRDDSRIGRTVNQQYLHRLLEWQINVFIGENSEDFFLLHSGAVAKNGSGIILPAPSESGKTSTTTGLTQKGYGYMSDEFAAIGMSDRLLHPFPKPISIKNTSVFPDLAEQKNLWIAPETEDIPEHEMLVWYIHPDDFAEKSDKEPVPVEYILFPQYSPSGKSHLEPMSSGDAVRQLVENSVNFHRFGGDALSIATALVANAQCFALTINGLDAATSLIDELTAN